MLSFFLISVVVSSSGRFIFLCACAFFKKGKHVVKKMDDEYVIRHKSFLFLLNFEGDAKLDKRKEDSLRLGLFYSVSRIVYQDARYALETLAALIDVHGEHKITSTLRHHFGEALGDLYQALSQRTHGCTVMNRYDGDDEIRQILINLRDYPPYGLELKLSGKCIFNFTSKDMKKPLFKSTLGHYGLTATDYGRKQKK